MTERYKIVEIEDGLLCYGKKLHKDASFYNFLKNNHQQMQPNIGSFSWFSLVLLPVTFNPWSRLYIIYETMRTVFILLNVFVVPLEVSQLCNEFL